MILISHRGNISGRNPERENTVDYISEAIQKGYDVEIDVWFVENKFFLGHDSPEVEIEEEYLQNKKLWCHAKNLEALEKMSQNKKIHCFWHQEDDFQLTSKNYIWTYPNKPLGRYSVCVLPENPRQISGVAGICLDDFSNFKREKDEQG